MNIVRSCNPAIVLQKGLPSLESLLREAEGRGWVYYYLWGVAPNPSYFFVLIHFCRSFFARPKNEPKKGAGNDNLGLFVRPLREALMAPPKSPRLASPSSRYLMPVYNNNLMVRSVRTVSGLPSHRLNYIPFKSNNHWIYIKIVAMLACRRLGLFPAVISRSNK